MFITTLFIIANTRNVNNPSAHKTNEWTNKIVIYPYNGMLLTNKRHTIVMFNNMDESYNNYTE